MQRSSWPDLAPGLLRDVSARLRDAGDFFRFHAVCKPWRDSHSRDATPSFPPWLLAVPEKDSAPSLKFRCIFSKSSYSATPPPPSLSCAPRRIWVSCADPSAVRYLTVEHLRPILHDPLMGEVTHLPLFLDGQWEEKNYRGAICGDGSTLLYSMSHVEIHHRSKGTFRAALLRPSDVEWTLVERTLDNPGWSGELCAVYRGGRILVTMDWETSLWHVITLDGSDDVLVPRMRIPGELASYSEKYNYVFESRGELLWASVQVQIYYSRHTVLVWVHALEEEASIPEKMRWVRKDGHSIADRVLFLGWSNSFAMDASLIGAQGGYAYFVHHKSKASPCERYGVFRYNLVDNNATFKNKSNNKVDFIERLPPGWDDGKCFWLVPKPDMASMQEINNESLEAQHQQLNLDHVTRPTRGFHIERLDDPCFKVLVLNLPVTINSSQLQLFFSNHGKVFSAEVVYYKKSKRSQGIGFVTIATVHAHPEDTIDALKDLVFDGCKLEVSFVNESPHRRRRRSFLTRESRVHTVISS